MHSIFSIINLLIIFNEYFNNIIKENNFNDCSPFFADVLSALQEIEHVSLRKPSVLEPITDNIAELLVSPQGNIRTLAHSLLARALKHRPASNANILSAFQRCLDSHRADVLMSALEKLPDIVLCMQGKICNLCFNKTDLHILILKYNNNFTDSLVNPLFFILQNMLYH